MRSVGPNLSNLWASYGYLRSTLPARPSEIRQDAEIQHRAMEIRSTRLLIGRAIFPRKLAKFCWQGWRRANTDRGSSFATIFAHISPPSSSQQERWPASPPPPSSRAPPRSAPTSGELRAANPIGKFWLLRCARSCGAVFCSPRQGSREAPTRRATRDATWNARGNDATRMPNRRSPFEREIARDADARARLRARSWRSSCRDATDAKTTPTVTRIGIRSAS